MATGPSFEVPETSTGPLPLGYSNTASVLEVRLDSRKGLRLAHCKRLAAYNQSVFCSLLR